MLQVRIVLGKYIDHHPTYVVEIKSTNSSTITHAGAVYRFGDWRDLNTKLIELQSGIPVDFPRTYQRMKVGVRLTRNQGLCIWKFHVISIHFSKDMFPNNASLCK